MIYRMQVEATLAFDIEASSDRMAKEMTAMVLRQSVDKHAGISLPGVLVDCDGIRLYFNALDVVDEPEVFDIMIGMPTLPAPPLRV